MSYYEYYEYETVAEKKAKASRALAKLKKKNPGLEPVLLTGRALAKSWWGKAWNRNLEGYADYENRIGRGRSYLRCGAILDLKINKGAVAAKVLGRRAQPYNTVIRIETLSDKRWHDIMGLCNRRIETLEELVAGKFPKELEVLFTDHRYSMFPAPEEIHFDCSCPDVASMCKHVAAVLYGVGARLDENPLLFFELRDIDSRELIKKTMEQKIESMLKNAGKRSVREIPAAEIPEIFGL